MDLRKFVAAYIYGAVDENGRVTLKFDSIDGLGDAIEVAEELLGIVPEDELELADYIPPRTLSSSSENTAEDVMAEFMAQMEGATYTISMPASYAGEIWHRFFKSLKEKTPTTE